MKTNSVPTLTDPRGYRSPRKLQEFFERVSRSTAPAQPPFLHRLGFSRSKTSTPPRIASKET